MPPVRKDDLWVMPSVRPLLSQFSLSISTVGSNGADRCDRRMLSGFVLLIIPSPYSVDKWSPRYAEPPFITPIVVRIRSRLGSTLDGVGEGAEAFRALDSTSGEVPTY